MSGRTVVPAGLLQHRVTEGWVDGGGEGAGGEGGGGGGEGGGGGRRREGGDRTGIDRNPPDGRIGETERPETVGLWQLIALCLA